MKKTVNINISGFPFIIDEDAYEKLQNYLNTIRGYFNSSDGRDEIMADIEARIAELFKEKMSDINRVISLKNVQDVIAVMGEPEQFVSEEDTQPKESSAKNNNEKEARSKRLYRDAEDNVLGGVCSGIGHYFGVDSVWLRIAFAIAFFVFGTGFLFYLLLWIVIPEAKSVAEKLEMKGEPVNIDNIGKAFEKEMEGVKNKFSEFGEKAKKYSSEKSKGKVQDLINRLVDFTVNVFTESVKTFAKFIAFVIMICAVILLVLLLASVFGEYHFISITNDESFSINYPEISGFLFSSDSQSMLFILSLVLFLGTPLIGLITWGLKSLLNIKTKSKIGKIALSVFWLSGLALAILTAYNMAGEFSKKEAITEDVSLANPAAGILYIKTYDFPEKYIRKGKRKKKHYYHEEFEIKKLSDDTLVLGYPTLDIVKSPNDSFLLEITKTSRGKTNKMAINLAEKINYSFSQQDSLLHLGNFYKISDVPWRAQKIEITLFVPENKAVFLDESVGKIIYDIKNTSNTADNNMLDKKWIMKKEGLTAENGIDEKSDNL